MHSHGPLRSPDSQLTLPLAWRLTRLLLRSFGERRSGIRIALGIIGSTLALVMLAGLALRMSIGAWRPTASLGLYGHEKYFDLRPVRFTVNDLHLSAHRPRRGSGIAAPTSRASDRSGKNHNEVSNGRFWAESPHDQ